MIPKSIGGILAASLLTVTLGLTGCTSAGGHAEGTHTMPDGTTMAGTSHALMCPKCETVWIMDTIGQGGRSERLASKRDMTCPSCEAMAASYMKDGEKVLHDCPDCKVTPIAVNRVATPAKLPRG
jgi:hypothetical protein